MAALPYTRNLAALDLAEMHPKEIERHAHNVAPGAWRVEGNLPLATLLGSCVSVCLYDLEARVGGMNHFMLPVLSRYPNSELDALLAGNYNMEALLNGLLARGARKQRMKAKAFGGGNILPIGFGQTSIGRSNADFTREWLARESIPLVACDFLGPWSRKLLFVPTTGDAWCRRMASSKVDCERLIREEKAYAARLARGDNNQGPPVELF